MLQVEALTLQKVELTGWEAMVYICPDLRNIVGIARHWVKNGGLDPVQVYNDVKTSQGLVGWGAADERLADSECFEIFISKLAEAVDL